MEWAVAFRTGCAIKGVLHTHARRRLAEFIKCSVGIKPQQQQQQQQQQRVEPLM